MNADQLDLSKLDCWLEFYAGTKKKIKKPSLQQIAQSLYDLCGDVAVTFGTVELYRGPLAIGSKGVYNLQFRGEDISALVVAGTKDNSRLLAPNFDELLGERADIEILGDDWPSSSVCTDSKIALEIATVFGVNGRFAYPHIWAGFSSL